MIEFYRAVGEAYIDKICNDLDARKEERKKEIEKIEISEEFHQRMMTLIESLSESKDR